MTLINIVDHRNEVSMFLENITYAQTLPEISVLCVGDQRSNYRLIPGLDLWDADRDAYKFTGSNPVIAHPPCQQWSRLRHLRTVKENKREKDLAFHCLAIVRRNGGILEHPAGSSFFKEAMSMSSPQRRRLAATLFTAGIRPTLSVNQSWFGFPARKTTYLYFHDYKPLSVPLSFDAITKKVEQMWGSSGERSRQPLDFCYWLVQCIQAGKTVISP